MEGEERKEEEKNHFRIGTPSEKKVVKINFEKFIFLWSISIFFFIFMFALKPFLLSTMVVNRSQLPTFSFRSFIRIKCILKKRRSKRCEKKKK